MMWYWEVMFVGDDGEEMSYHFRGTREQAAAVVREVEDAGYGYIEIFQGEAVA